MQELNGFLGKVFDFSQGIIGILILIFLAWGITRQGASFLQSTIFGRLSLIEIRFVSAFILLFLLIFAITGFILEQNSGPEVYQQWWLYNMTR